MHGTRSDLIGEIVPYIKDARVLHQFSSNEADRVVRVVSQPPIPMVSGLEAVTQRFGHDLLDTPWEAFCLVETGPTWEDSVGDCPAPSGQTYRGFTRPPPYQRDLKQVDVKKMAALGCPAGMMGECTTIIVSARGDLKIPRYLIPNWLVTWLIRVIGRFVYKRALEIVEKFDSSSHGERLRNSDLYVETKQRIKEHMQRRAKGETPAFSRLPLR